MNPRDIRAFCVDYNWDSLGRFASPGLYGHADPRALVRWHAGLGANVLQTFCVSHNGHAWYQSRIAPVTPGLRGDFLRDVAELGAEAGMLVFGYFSPGANSAWGHAHPELHHRGIWNWRHVPLSTTYLDHLCALVAEALRHAPLHGLLIDWLWNPDPRWIPVERAMFTELLGDPFPADGVVPDEVVLEYQRRAVARAWRRLFTAARDANPDVVLWLSCDNIASPVIAGTPVLREVDWLMNEHPEPARIAAARAAARPDTTLIQCLCGWGEHDAAAIARSLGDQPLGHYGFARPDPATALPAEDGPDAPNIRALRTLWKPAR
jgi:hypothetical protein